MLHRRQSQPVRPSRLQQPCLSKYNLNLASLLRRNVRPSKPNPLKRNSRSRLLPSARSSSSPPQHPFLPPPQHCRPASCRRPCSIPHCNPLPVAATISAAKPPDPVTPAVATTITAAQLQALPASGRRWQAFLLDTPAAGASADGSQLSFRGSQQSARVTVDGANIGVAFGVFAGSGMRSSDSTGADSDPQKLANQSGSQAWTGGRGLGVSEAAIHDVTTVAGNVEADGMRSAGGRTTIHTESGSNSFTAKAPSSIVRTPGAPATQTLSGSPKPRRQPSHSIPPAQFRCLRRSHTRRQTTKQSGASELAATYAATSCSGSRLSTAIAATIRDWRWLSIRWTFAEL